MEDDIGLETVDVVVVVGLFAVVTRVSKRAITRHTGRWIRKQDADAKWILCVAQALIITESSSDRRKPCKSARATQ